ncbi:hypothetical protein LINPERHAP2_LOCUS3341 [Linum perenne]
MSPTDERPSTLTVIVEGSLHSVEMVSLRLEVMLIINRKLQGKRTRSRLFGNQKSLLLILQQAMQLSSEEENAAPQTWLETAAEQVSDNGVECRSGEKASPGTPKEGSKQLLGSSDAKLAESLGNDLSDCSSSTSDGDNTTKIPDPLSPENFPPFKRGIEGEENGNMKGLSWNQMSFNSTIRRGI